MRKISSLFLCLLFSAMSFAGGLLTNSNQSTQYVRTLSRNASTGIDAVYYNPAGLSKLGNGFYLTVDNQSIFQTKTITNSFYLLNSSEFEGKVSAPLFPTGFAVYKMDKLAFSLGFGPNAGGGSATFEKGLPSFEIPISSISALLSAKGVPATGYSTNIKFDGSSIFWGAQLNATYKMNEMISVALGVRYINAKNTYEGSITNTNILIGTTTNNTPTPAPDLFLALAKKASDAATAFGAYPADMVIPANIAQAAGLPTGITFGQAISALQKSAIESTLTSTVVANQEVEVAQTGTGFTPLVGLNITPIENLNIGLKYEFLTKLELTNETTKDFIKKYSPDGKPITQFPNEAKTYSDIPAILAVGAEYKMGKLSTSLSYTQYFDKQANWGGREKLIDHGLWEIGLGLEYKLSDRFLVSIGGNHSETGVQPAYQTDLSYSNSSNTVGLGCQIVLTKKIDLNLGVLNTFYVKNQNDKYHVAGFYKTGSTTELENYTETYQKTTMVFSLGLDFKLF